MPTANTVATFWEKVSRGADDACWLWRSTKDRKGYGRFKVNCRAVRAHRFAYEQLRGPIPPALTIDHLCKVKACVNPAHLEVVTREENSRRADTGKRNRDKTHCPRGHEYSPSNTYIYGTSRCCRTCVIDRALARYRARKQTGVPTWHPGERS